MNTTARAFCVLLLAGCTLLSTLKTCSGTQERRSGKSALAGFQTSDPDVRTRPESTAKTRPDDTTFAASFVVPANLVGKNYGPLIERDVEAANAAHPQTLFQDSAASAKQSSTRTFLSTDLVDQGKTRLTGTISELPVDLFNLAGPQEIFARSAARRALREIDSGMDLMGTPE